MWAWVTSLFSFQTKDTRKRSAEAAAAVTPDKSDPSAKKPRLDIPDAPKAAALPPAPAAPVGKAENGFRSMAAAHKDRDKIMKGVDMCGLPVGPYDTEEQLVKAVQAWAANPATNGGAFAIPPKKESLAISKTRGPRRLLWCDRSGQTRTTKTDNSRPRQLTKKCDCPWGLWIEQCQEGWTTVEMPKKARALLRELDSIHTVATIHNHTLLQTVDEMNTNTRLRNIPEDLQDMAEILSRAACTPLQIFLALSRECQRLGRAITFTREDVGSKYVTRIGGDHPLVCSNLIQYLRGRQSADASLSFDFCNSQDGNRTLERVFVVVQGGIERWKQSKAAAVLLHNNKHGINRYGHALGFLTYVDETGKTQALAITLLLHENEEAFEWVFKEFSQAFGDDRDAAFAQRPNKWKIAA
jgi:hypothetical protein